MRLSEIEVGGRYYAKVSRRVEVIRVTAIREMFQRGRRVNYIFGVNETTHRSIIMRSPQRLRGKVPETATEAETC